LTDAVSLPLDHLQLAGAPTGDHPQLAHLPRQTIGNRLQKIPSKNISAIFPP
jgi:hypothetical protein